MDDDMLLDDPEMLMSDEEGEVDPVTGLPIAKPVDDDTEEDDEEEEVL